jgi:hypothetical protein
MGAALGGVTAGLGALMTIASGRQQQAAHDQQAKQAELQAKSLATQRTNELNETLAMQNAAMGYSGRSGDSITSVLEGDKKRYMQDINMINATGQYQKAQSHAAGGVASTTGYVNAGIQGLKYLQSSGMLSGAKGSSMSLAGSSASPKK